MESVTFPEIVEIQKHDLYDSTQHMSKRDKVVVIEYKDGSWLFDGSFQNDEPIETKWLDEYPSYTPDLSMATRYTARQAEMRARSIRTRDIDPSIRNIFATPERMAFAAKVS